MPDDRSNGWGGPIWDTHIHLDRNNRGVAAAQDFANAGGTHLCLVHKPGFGVRLPESIAEVDEAYDETVRMAEVVRDRVEIDVRVVLGPHPVVWEKQIHTIGIEAASELHLESCQLALDMIGEGKAVALGEVGRPHYPVSEETRMAADEQLAEIMRMAAAEGVPIQLHVEDDGAATNRDLASLCDRSGLPRRRAVHHYAPADVSEAFTHGMSASVSVGKGSVATLIETLGAAAATWTMETDFLDDPTRPGAVLGPKTVPKRTHALLAALEGESGRTLAEEVLTLVHDVWPSELYGE